MLVARYFWFAHQAWYMPSDVLFRHDKNPPTHRTLKNNYLKQPPIYRKLKSKTFLSSLGPGWYYPWKRKEKCFFSLSLYLHSPKTWRNIEYAPKFSICTFPPTSVSLGEPEGTPAAYSQLWAPWSDTNTKCAVSQAPEWVVEALQVNW